MLRWQDKRFEARATLIMCATGWLIGESGDPGLRRLNRPALRGAGFLFATDGGIFWLDIFDYFIGLAVLPAVLLECLAVAFLRGADVHMRAVAPQLGADPDRLGPALRRLVWVWQVDTPVLLLLTVADLSAKLVSPPEYPGWALMVRRGRGLCCTR
jgi:hypothetical protein